MFYMNVIKEPQWELYPSLGNTFMILQQQVNWTVVRAGERQLGGTSALSVDGLSDGKRH